MKSSIYGGTSRYGQKLPTVNSQEILKKLIHDAHTIEGSLAISRQFTLLPAISCYQLKCE